MLTLTKQVISISSVQYLQQRARDVQERLPPRIRTGIARSDATNSLIRGRITSLINNLLQDRKD